MTRVAYHLSTLPGSRPEDICDRHSSANRTSRHARARRHLRLQPLSLRLSAERTERKWLSRARSPRQYPLMTTLLDGIVDRLIPPFSLSKTEGDAVFAFAADGELQLRGEAVLRCIDLCYQSFRSQIEAMEAALTCGCNACSLGINLDLKFVLHHGGYVVQPIAGRPELLGPDVKPRAPAPEERRSLGGGGAGVRAVQQRGRGALRCSDRRSTSADRELRRHRAGRGLRVRRATRRSAGLRG